MIFYEPRRIFEEKNALIPPFLNIGVFNTEIFN